MLFPLRRHSQIYQTKCGPKPSQFLWLELGASNATSLKRSKNTIKLYSRLPITRHGMFIQHTPCIWPNTFTKRWDMINRIRTKRKRTDTFNWIMLLWSVSILKGVIPYEPLLVFGACHSKWQSWLIFHPFSILWVTTFIQHMTQMKWWATTIIQHTSSNWNWNTRVSGEKNN